MKLKKTVAILNQLIELNYDRIEGYDTAAKEFDDKDLRLLFSKFSKTSENCNQELIHEVKKYGGKPAEGAGTVSKFYRAWMKIQTALTSNEQKTILKLCEYGDDVTLKTYKDYLVNELEHLNSEQQLMIQNQFLKIKEDQDTIKNLLETFTEETHIYSHDK